MLNLFLAILLGNFDKARNFGQKKKVFEAFYEIMGDVDEFGNKKYNLNQSLDIILGDMSYYVKTKVLKWDQKQVDRLYVAGETRIGQDLVADKFEFIPEVTDRTVNGEIECASPIAGAETKVLSSSLALPNPNVPAPNTLQLPVRNPNSKPNKKAKLRESQIERERMHIQKQSII